MSREEVIEIVLKYLNLLTPKEVSLCSRLESDLSLDGLDIMMLQLDIEEDVPELERIYLGDEIFDKVDPTVEDLVDIVMETVGKREEEDEEKSIEFYKRENAALKEEVASLKIRLNDRAIFKEYTERIREQNEEMADIMERMRLLNIAINNKINMSAATDQRIVDIIEREIIQKPYK